jgi:hypothetical protein
MIRRVSPCVPKVLFRSPLNVSVRRFGEGPKYSTPESIQDKVIFLIGALTVTGFVGYYWNKLSKE